MADLTIPIPSRRPVMLEFAELGGRRVPLRPLTGRSLALYQQFSADPGRMELLLDIAETLIGGEAGLTRAEIEGLSLDALEAVILTARRPIADLEAAAAKDVAPGATAPA